MAKIFFFSILLFSLPLFAEGDFLIDINNASREELEEIAGIGHALAERIVEARPFYSLDDLTRVERIGEKTLQKIKEQGLAWVDPEKKPELKPADPKESDDPEMMNSGEELKSEAIESKAIRDVGQAGSLKSFLPASVIALFSAFTILALKKAILKFPENS